MALKDTQRQMLQAVAFFEILTPEQKQKAYDHLDWARRVLQFQPAVLWYTRVVRDAVLAQSTHEKDAAKTAKVNENRSRLADLFALITGRQGQFKAMAENLMPIRKAAPAAEAEFRAIPWDSLVVANDAYTALNTVGQGATELKDLERGEKVVEFADGSMWEKVKGPKGDAHCPIEGKVMGHCGAVNYKGHLLSYRIPTAYPGVVKPRITMVLGNGGEVTEMKGPANNKPQAMYHDKIVELFKKPFIKKLTGGGYRQDQNFQLSDLSPQLLDELVKARPDLIKTASDNVMGSLKKADLLNDVSSDASAAAEPDDQTSPE